MIEETTFVIRVVFFWGEARFQVTTLNKKAKQKAILKWIASCSIVLVSVLYDES